MPDYDQFQTGAVVQPLTADLTNSLLQDADPALYYASDFWKFVLKQYVEPRLVAQASRANLGQDIAAATRQIYVVPPEPEYLENQFQLPSLFVYRTRGQTEEWTISRDHDVCGFDLWWVLPPMDIAGMNQLYPILTAAYKALRNKTNDGWDPSYTPPGGTQGQQRFLTTLGLIEEIGFGRPITRKNASVETGFEYAKFPATGNLFFPAILMRGYVTERDEYNPTQGGVSKFTGADITGNVEAGDQTVVPAPTTTVVQARTDVGPTITSLTATSGPSTGGTPVTIDGTGFMTGPPSVFFGPPNAPTFAPTVSYVSADLLNIVTPAMQGAGTVDITVLNRDGQGFTLSQAFTFQ